MVNVLFNLILSPFREKKRHWITSVDFKVQRKGLEPSWYCYHTDLNRARLPFRHLCEKNAENGT